MFASIKQHLLNLPGWRTNRKIVVFESDDWGSIRSSSNESLDALRKIGVKVDHCAYMKNDALASEEDLNKLHSVLLQFRDGQGKHPVITANSIMANPDFEAIGKSNFEEYKYEPFTETLAKYPEHRNSFDLWKEGMQKKVFFPQLHGREHLQVSRWLTDLQKGVKDTLEAFKYRMFGISGHVALNKRNSYMAALDIGKPEFNFDRSKAIKEAASIFKDHFGFESRSFIAPNYIWDDEIEQALANADVKYIQGTHTQKVSRKDGEPLKTIKHFIGNRNDLGQLYLTRNTYFEPTSNPNKDWVKACMKDIQRAFLWNKPAIISTHRVNYVGFLNSENREKNLTMLKELLEKMINKWPDIEFMNTVELADLIDQQNKSGK